MDQIGKITQKIDKKLVATSKYLISFIWLP